MGSAKNFNESSYTLKLCLECGEKISPILPGGSILSPKQYQKRIFCCHACASEHLRRTRTKHQSPTRESTGESILSDPGINLEFLQSIYLLKDAIPALVEFVDICRRAKGSDASNSAISNAVYHGALSTARILAARLGGNMQDGWKETRAALLRFSDKITSGPYADTINATDDRGTIIPKKDDRLPRSNVMEFICSECAKELGANIPTPHFATWHDGICDRCKKWAPVTEPRDFGI